MSKANVSAYDTMTDCMFKGDTFKSAAMAGKAVLSTVVSSICMKMAMANNSGK